MGQADRHTSWRRTDSIVFAAASALVVLLIVGTGAALLSVPNFVATQLNGECPKCWITPLLDGWNVRLDVAGLSVSAWVLGPTIPLSAGAGLLLARRPRWILDRRRYLRRALRAMGIGAAVASLAAAAIVLESSGGTAVTSPSSMQAPNFGLRLPNGTRLELQSYMGRAVLIQFASTSCQSCLDQLDGLRQVQRIFPPLVVLSVAPTWSGDTLDSIRQYASEHRLAWPFGVDEGDATRLYNIKSVLTLILLDENLRIVYRREGLASADELIQQVSKLMPYAPT